MYYIPIINCGLEAGFPPYCWDKTMFETAEECRKWIEDNIDNFTSNELSGGVYPHEIKQRF